MFELFDIQYKHILHIEHVRIDHQITCLMGGSGSGKTTLLRMLNLLNKPDTGSITYNGNDITQMNPVELRRSVVMLAQQPIIYEGTIEDNLQIGRVFAGKVKASRIELLDMLEKVDVRIALEKGCQHLSGGEKQRLCLARILLMDAEVYLVDEPSAALDKETELCVIHQLKKYVLEHNKKLIMVTHSQDIADMFREDIMEIKDGMCRGYKYE